MLSRSARVRARRGAHRPRQPRQRPARRLQRGGGAVVRAAGQEAAHQRREAARAHRGAAQRGHRRAARAAEALPRPVLVRRRGHDRGLGEQRERRGHAPLGGGPRRARLWEPTAYGGHERAAHGPVLKEKGVGVA